MTTSDEQHDPEGIAEREGIARPEGPANPEGTAQPVDVRVLSGEDELEASERVFRTAMVGLPAPREPEAGRIPSLREPGRTFGAYTGSDGGNGAQLVGATDSTSGTMIVPGGARVPHAAVTHIGVVPTHTRRGVLSALMRRQLGDCRERGDVVASLRASEATIYGRFGYGIATSARSVSLDLRAARLRPGIEVDPRVHLVPPAESWDLLRRIADDHPVVRPGAISRGAQWWNGRRTSSVSGPRYTAVYGARGAESGFVSYRPVGTHEWFTSPERTIVVDDIHAPTLAAYRALLAFLMRLDLVHTVVFPFAPEDDPLPWMLTDQRAARVTGVGDETWLRLLDVPGALAARTYGPGRSVVVDVRDELLPSNAGRYRIAEGGAQASAQEPDVSVDVADLAAAYLGGVRWHQLFAAGRVRVRDSAVLAGLEVLFGTTAAPFAGVMF